MKAARTFALFALLALLLCAASASAEEDPVPTLPGKDIQWSNPEEGLDMAILSFTKEKTDEFSRRLLIRVLRFDTSRFDFQLFSSRWEEGPVPSLREWAENKHLAAAVNACMYHKDGETSTGYMRSGDKLNNGRIVSRYGAFFVAGPRVPGLPRAAGFGQSRRNAETPLTTAGGG